MVIINLAKFSDARIQDVSTSISINMRIQENLNNLTERYESDDDDESDKHLEARDRRYSCLILMFILYILEFFHRNKMLEHKCNLNKICWRIRTPTVFNLFEVTAVRAVYFSLKKDKN